MTANDNNSGVYLNANKNARQAINSMRNFPRHQSPRQFSDENLQNDPKALVLHKLSHSDAIAHTLFVA